MKEGDRKKMYEFGLRIMKNGNIGANTVIKERKRSECGILGDRKCHFKIVFALCKHCFRPDFELESKTRAACLTSRRLCGFWTQAKPKPPPGQFTGEKEQFSQPVSLHSF